MRYYGLLLMSVMVLRGVAGAETDRVVARYSNGTVTESDLQFYLFKFNGSSVRKMQYSLENAQIEAAKDIVLESLLAHEAAPSKIEEGTSIKSDLGLLEKMVTKHFFLADRIRITEPHLRDYYSEHLQDFARESEVTLSHIFRGIPSDSTPELKETIRRSMEDLRQRALQGEDFSELAKQYSELPNSKMTGGRVRKAPLGKMNAAVRSAVQGLKPGEMSGVIETPYGFEILKLEEYVSGFQRTFDEVKKDIYRKLFHEQSERMIAQLIQAPLAASALDVDVVSNRNALPDSVVFRLDGRPVTLDELQRLYAAYRQDAPLREMDSETLRKTVTGIFADEWIFQQGQKSGLCQRADVMRAIELIRNRMVAETYLRLKESEVIVSDSEIESYYRSHREELLGKPAIQARLIRMPLRFPPNLSPQEKHELTLKRLEEAKRLVDRLRKGEDFAALAKRYSSDPSALQGGALGWVSPGPMGYHFDTAAFKLKAGEVSDPVLYPEGIMVIMVEQRKEPQPLSLEEAAQAIRGRLLLRKKSEWLESYIQRLLSEADIEFVNETLPSDSGLSESNAPKP